MSLDLQHSYTNDTLVGFQQSPNGRGTLNILFSCLLTLSLCVWSATHLDLPKQAETKWHYAVRYFKWSVLGMFGPELLVWVAWRQYISARVLTKTIRELTRGNNNAISAQNWTMVHSFYVGMGGLVFDLNDLDIESRFIPDFARLHVTPRGVQLLAQCGLLPHISEEDIVDKSKTDATGKLICCAQVGWFMVQVVTRLAAGLSITPLEVNTIAHVVGALLVYSFWWYKPRWVNVPTRLRGDWMGPICAFMYMSSQVSATSRQEKDLLRNFGVKTELAGVFYSPCNSEAANGEEDCKMLGQPTSSSPNHNTTDSASKPIPHSGSIIARSERGTLEAAEEDPEALALEGMRQTRWKLCCEAIERYHAISQRMKFPEHSVNQTRYREALQRYPEMPKSIQQRFQGYDAEEHLAKLPTGRWIFMSEELVVDHPRNWPGDELIRAMQGHLMGMIMWAASIVYGAIHLAAWNERFPSVFENWFWRASSLYVVFSGVLWSLLNLLGHCSGTVWIYWYDFLADGMPRKSHVLIYVLAFIGGAFYFIARTYLVVEAFISLRALPVSAYASPSWILTVPHIG